MKAKEIKVTDREQLPDYIYHLAPRKIYEKYTDKMGGYDCRNSSDWGKSSPFIHTTTSLEDLKNKVAPQWADYPMNVKFVLLKITTARIAADFTYAIVNGTVYYHIWGALPKTAYSVLPAGRNFNGSFDL